MSKRIMIKVRFLFELDGSMQPGEPRHFPTQLQFNFNEMSKSDFKTGRTWIIEQTLRQLMFRLGDLPCVVRYRTSCKPCSCVPMNTFLQVFPECDSPPEMCYLTNQ